MNRFFKVSGLLSFIVLLATLVLSYSIHPELDRFYPVFSDWGKYPETMNIFNLGLIVTGLLQTIFAVYVSVRLGLKQDWLTGFFLIASGVVTFLLGLIPIPPEDNINLQRIVHRILTGLVFFLLPLGLIGLGLKERERFKVPLYLGVFSLVGAFAIFGAFASLLMVEVWSILTGIISIVYLTRVVRK